MAKQSGLGDRLFGAGYDLSGDVGSLGNIGGGPALLDVTGLDVSAHERIGGQRDGRFEYTAWFNPAAGRSHEWLSTLPAGSQVLTYCRGTGLGAPAAGIVGKQLNYDGSRASDGAFTLDVATQIADGYPVEWGALATPGVVTDTAPTNRAGIDYSASSDFGLVAYLHVTALTGVAVNVFIQHSSDNGVGDPWAGIVGADFTQVTGPGAERIETSTATTLKRYLRVGSDGVFSSASFVVMIMRRIEAQT